MSAYDFNNSYDHPSHRRRRERASIYNHLDGPTPNDAYEYHTQSPRRNRSNKRPKNSQGRRSTRQSTPRRSRRDSWSEDDYENFEDAMMDYPPPPHWPPPFHPGPFIGPEHFDPYGYDHDYDHDAMLAMDDGIIGPPPPPPHHFFPGFPPPMAGPPFLPPEQYFRRLEDEDGEDDSLSDGDEHHFRRPPPPFPPFLDGLPPPGLLPPLPHLGPMIPPPPPPDFLARLERSRSLPTRKRRPVVAPLDMEDDKNLPPPRPVRRSSTRGPRPRKQPSVRRRANSISSSPGGLRPPPHGPPLSRPHVMSAPGSPVELYSPTMEDQFHDALSQQDDSSSENDEIAMQRRRRPLSLRRRSLSVLPTRPPLLPRPPIPPLGRRHSVFDRLPPSDMVPLHPVMGGLPPPPPHMPAAMAMLPPPDLGGDRSGGNSNVNSAPGTPWMPASFFSSPPMGPGALPHQQQQLPPPQGTGMGMMPPPPPPFGPTMNPFMMNPFGHPPMSMMSMMGGMFDSDDGMPGNEGSVGVGGLPPGSGGGMDPLMGPPSMGSFSAGGPPVGPPMMGGGGGGVGPENDGMDHSSEPSNPSGGGGGGGSGGGVQSSNLQVVSGGAGGPPISGPMGLPPPQMMGGGPVPPMMRGGPGEPPVRRKSLFGSLFGNGGGGGGGPKPGVDISMFDPNAIVPLEDALQQMTLDGGGGGGGPFMESGLGSSSARSFGGGLSRSSSHKLSTKAQELRRFPGIWCYRPRNMMSMMPGDNEGAGDNVWAAFSVNNQHKLHRYMGGSNPPPPTINLDKEEKLQGTIRFSPSNGIAYYYRSLLSGQPEILDVQYIQTQGSQFMVRPEVTGRGGGPGGGMQPPQMGRTAAGGPGMATKLLNSVFGS